MSMMIDLLAFNVKNAFDGDKFEKALKWLPKEEHASVLRYKYEKDRHLGLGSLLLRRHYFTKELHVDWNELEFGRLPQGKPFLKNTVEYDYNTSHEGDWVIFGCAKNNMKIGIDAVAIDRPKDISIDAFIQSFTPQLTGDEFDFIMTSGDDEETRLKTFYQYWGCKESYIKAIGVGLSLDLKKIRFLNDHSQIKIDFEGRRLNNWCFHLSYLDQKTIAVVCSGFTDPNKPIEDMDFVKTSEPLGKPLHGTESKGIYDQVKFEDIENSRNNKIGRH